MTEKEIKFSEWYLSHKLLFKKILTGILIAISGGLLIFSAVLFIDWAFVTGPKERANLKTSSKVTISPEARESIKAENIIFGGAQTFAGGVGRYDVVAEIRNPNDLWWADLEYRFLGEGLSGQWRKAFVLPGDKKYLTELGLSLPFHPRNVYLETRNMRYHRIDNHEIPNFDQWRKDHGNIILTDKEFKQEKSSGAISFKAKNDTAYNFWDTGFYALLYRGDQLASVNYTVISNFLSGETREVRMSFYEGLPTITKFEIITDLNIFDEKIYIPQD